MEKVSDSRLTPQRLHSRDEMGGAGAPPFADGDFTAFHSAAKPPGKGQLRPICIITWASDSAWQTALVNPRRNLRTARRFGGEFSETRSGGWGRGARNTGGAQSNPL